MKSQIGHTKAAAGAAGLIKAALALHHKVLPPTTKVQPADRVARGGESPFYLNTEARPWFPDPDEPRRAAVSAFGFGGSNFHCVLEEAGPEKTEIDWDGDVQILALSADRARTNCSSSSKRSKALPIGPRYEARQRGAARSFAVGPPDRESCLSRVAARPTGGAPCGAKTS